MRIAISGYGKMGKAVEAAAISRGHSIAAIFELDKRMTPEALHECNAEVVIDFTQPDSVLPNALAVSAAKIPLVIGTTGWHDDKGAIIQMVRSAHVGFVYASNFSIGVNLFLRIVREAAKALSTSDYDVYISEAHHNAKKDHPSGTALRIAEEVLAGFPSKKEVVSSLTQGEAPSKEALIVSSIRAGAITGTHTVGFESDVDSIELTHRAKSRTGFALGSVRAAEWIVGKEGVYRFEDHLSEILGLWQ